MIAFFSRPSLWLVLILVGLKLCTLGISARLKPTVWLFNVGLLWFIIDYLYFRRGAVFLVLDVDRWRSNLMVTVMWVLVEIDIVVPITTDVIMISMMIVTWFKIMTLVALVVALFVVRMVVVRVWKSRDKLNELYYCLFIVRCALRFA